MPTYHFRTRSAESHCRSRRDEENEAIGDDFAGIDDRLPLLYAAEGLKMHLFASFEILSPPLLLADCHVRRCVHVLVEYQPAKAGRLDARTHDNQHAIRSGEPLASTVTVTLVT